MPLLGGHHGANRLARDIAEALGVRAAITTAGDTALGFALDAPPPGWRLGEGALVKDVTAALLAGEPVRLVTEAASADWLTAGGAPFGDRGRLTVHITERCVVPGDDVADVTLHPAVLALGLGCERGCAPGELVMLAKRVLGARRLAPEAVACVASLDLKADEPAVNAVAEWLGVPLRLFDAAALERETPRLTAPSEVVFRAVGCHGVAEAAALACAGADGTLAMPKARSERGTCAIAKAPAIIEPEHCGRGRGRVTVVGIGPGARAWRTPGADAAIANATDLVGYSRYLDLLGPSPPGCARHAYPIGAEEERARAALALAAEGRHVALVSSGDAGVYGMASLLFELLDGEAGEPRWRGIELAVEPGVSALQAAAARAGAPIGHDFCAISLSDLLTPWPAIARRLRAAAEADFVVALYNPASGRRRTRLTQAREILAAHRPLRLPRGRRPQHRAGRRAGHRNHPGRARHGDGRHAHRRRRRQQTDPAAGAGRPGLALHPARLRARQRGKASQDGEARDGSLHRRGPRRCGPDHRARAVPCCAARPVVLYAGSLVPPMILAEAPEGARIVDTAPLDLDAIVAEMAQAAAAGHEVARLHSGDPSLYGAIAEQMRRLDRLGIPYDVTPGVPAYAAAAAALRQELTLPGVAQTVILTRTAVRASSMPDDEQLERLAAAGGTLAIHLSINNLARVTRALIPHRGAGLPHRRRLPRELARRADRARHPRHHPGQGEGARAHADGADPRRPSPRCTRLRREPPLRPRPSPRVEAEALAQALLDPGEGVFERRGMIAGRRGRAAHHHHGEPERPRRRELGRSGIAPACTGDHAIDALGLEQRALVVLGKGTTGADQPVLRERDRLGRLVHQPHQEPELGAARERRKRADADGEKHPFRLGRDRRHGGVHRVDLDPTIARHRAPGRAHEHEPPGPCLRRCVARLGRDLRGKRDGWRRSGSPISFVTAGRTRDPSPRRSRRCGLSPAGQQWGSGAACERRNHREGGAEACLGYLRQRTALGRAAQNQQSGRFRGRRGQRSSLRDRR